MIMKVQTELNSLIKRNLWFSCAVQITGVLALHDSLLMVQLSLNDTISNSFSDNKLGVLGTVQHQLLSDVTEGDLAVGQGDGLHGSLDDVLVEPEISIRIFFIPVKQTG